MSDTTGPHTQEAAPTMTAPAYATDRTILPGPHPTEATVTTALRVLAAAAENIVRIDVDSLRALIADTGYPVTEQTRRTVEAAARFRAALIGAAPAVTLSPPPVSRADPAARRGRTTARALPAGNR